MPQLNFLTKNSLYASLRKDILNYLRSHPGFYTSHEILENISTASSVNNLRIALLGYSGGFSEVASHIGAVAGYLSNAGVLKRSMKSCSILNRSEDSFSV